MKNITVNTIFMISVKLFIASLCLYHFSIRRKVLRRILIKMNRSKYWCACSL